MQEVTGSSPMSPTITPFHAPADRITAGASLARLTHSAQVALEDEAPREPLLQLGDLASNGRPQGTIGYLPNKRLDACHRFLAVPPCRWAGRLTDSLAPSLLGSHGTTPASPALAAYRCASATRVAPRIVRKGPHSTRAVDRVAHAHRAELCGPPISARPVAAPHTRGRLVRRSWDRRICDHYPPRRRKYGHEIDLWGSRPVRVQAWLHSV